MDLLLKDQLFIVGGASSGFGKAIAETLLMEGANVIAVARGKDKLLELKRHHGDLETLAIDLTEHNAISALQHLVGDRQLHGIVVNAGGPPALKTLETKLEDWDGAYRKLMRWKIALFHAFVPQMIQHNYGRILLIESYTVKQPLENLVLSNAFRVAVINTMKTLSYEVASSGVTLNALAPGSHDTSAIDRIYKKQSEDSGINFDTIKKKAIQAIPVGKLGVPEDFASLAAWLLSPHSRFITGQTISVDGGLIKGIFG